MRLLMSAVVAASVAVPMPVHAVAADNVAANNSADKKMVCRSSRDHNLGTRIRAPRVCRTRAQWRELEEHTQNELQQIRDGQAPSEGSGSSAVAGGPAL